MNQPQFAAERAINKQAYLFEHRLMPGVLFNFSIMFGRLYFICCVLLLAGCVNDMSEVEQTAALADPGIEKERCGAVLFRRWDGKNVYPGHYPLALSY